MVKPHWDTEELIDNWTLLPQELELVNNKVGANQIGFAILLKYFQIFARFPNSPKEIPSIIISYIAQQLKIPETLYSEYNWQGRSISNHRASIRKLFGFRTATIWDGEEMLDWLKAEILPNELNYEISVLQALRERLCCKEIWVVGANRYRNPDEDLPTDFDQHRQNYYQALTLPEDVETFISDLQQRMASGLEKLDKGMPKNSDVTLIGQNQGLIRLRPFEPAPEPINLKQLKGEINRLWHQTSLLDAIFEIRSPDIWGEGTTTCASDSKHFGAWSQNLMTQYHLRYGGRGVMIYWHVEKKSTCIYSQLKTCSSSEVAAMIEGVLRHCTSMEVEKNYVDSHGQSEVAFAFTHLLGFQLMPRLKRLKTQRLYRPYTGQSDVYPHLKPILTRPINWDLIRTQYDQMVKYTTALRLETAETSAILKRFSKNPFKHPTYLALMELGRAIKTIFLCQYLDEEAVRREVNEGLNVVERWNGVNDFIFYGKGGEFASNRLETQELSVLSLHLLQICLVYVNTLMIQRVLAQENWSKKLTATDLRAITPLIFSHVNPYGLFKLDLTERIAWLTQQEVA